MNTTIIGICGRKRHGKDTVGRILSAQYGFRTTSFADPIKRIAMQLYGLTWDQCFGDGPMKETVDPRWDLSPREILQRLGTEVARSIHPDTWVRHTLDGVRAAADGRGYSWRDEVNHRFETYPGPVPHVRWAITDVRFPNEAALIRAAGGLIWKVVRPNLALPVDEHPSETSVDLVEADAVIVNDGTLDALTARVDVAMSGVR